jgi:hypothetical protein
MKTNIIGLVGLSLVAAAGSFAYLQEHKQLEVMRRDMRALRAEMQEAQPAQTVVVERTSVVPAVAQHMDDEKPSGERNATAPAGHEAKAPPADFDLAVKTAVEAGFASETRDQAWSATARLRLSEAVTRLLPEGSGVRDIDCRSTLCRIELSHSDPNAERGFMEKAIHDPEGGFGNGPGYVSRSEPAADGTFVEVIYLAREGATLPSAELY